MKQLIFFALFLVKASTVFSQYTDSLEGLSANDYLVKSRSQKAGAVILTVAGSVGLLATVISDFKHTDLTGLGYVVGYLTPGGYTPSTAPEPRRNSHVVPYLLSAAAILGAIPLYVAAAKNKNTYHMLSAHVKFEKRPALDRNTIHPITYPAFALRLKLK